MEINKLISIIMPAYNSEKYIEMAINSVIKQAYQSWELIVIDDKSTDDTLNIIKRLSKKDYRIKVYKNEKNLGVSITRKKGIEIAKGNWIAFLDSDDLWEITKLKKQITFAEEKNAEFIYTGSSFINEAGFYYKMKFQVPYKVNYKVLKNHNVISCSSVLIKRQFLSDVKTSKDDMHEDYALWLQILQKGISAYGINEPLLIYRISRNSKSGNKLKTFKMTYRVYRFIGINPISSIYFLSRHILGSLKKYKSLDIDRSKRYLT